MAGRIRSIEKSNDFMGYRTRDLPACSIVPQPTTNKSSVTILIMKVTFFFALHVSTTSGYHQEANQHYEVL
jgi:hypothetical protein